MWVKSSWFNIAIVKVNNFSVNGGTIETVQEGEIYALGIYDTRERALEVLEEMCKHLEMLETSIYHTLLAIGGPGGGMQPFPSTVIYEMPER